jgi:thiol-disulfide isomerase/thioredoxin
MKKWAILSITILATTFLYAAKLNQPAPKFSLPNARKQIRSLSGYRGKVVFINFWASWCAPCQEELPELSRLAADYRGKKVVIVAINVDQDRNAAKKLIAKLGLTTSPIDILWDTKSKVVSVYDIETMPSSFILDARGVIRFTHSGFHSQDPVLWRKEIESLSNL